MFGMRLELPHYHNARADFAPKSIVYIDNTEDAKRRFRKAEITLEARVPVVRVHRLPLQQPRFTLGVEG